MTRLLVEDVTLLRAENIALHIRSQQAESRRRRLLRLSPGRYLDPYNGGTIYLGLGDADKAFEWFERAFQDRSEALLFLKVEPRFDLLWADPRYKSLIRRLGLPL